MLNQPTSHRKATEYGKVAVLLGGFSAEREVSLNSGEAIYQALKRVDVDVVKIDPKEGLIEKLQQFEIERVFIALHGRGGEDGVIQGLLETMSIPYTGSSLASSAISMNKLLSKQIWKQLNIPTANFKVVSDTEKVSINEANKILEGLGENLFVKPVKEGSSVGMSKASTATELLNAIKLAHQYDEQALIESFISGKEYTVSILNNVALPSINMCTPREFYDYEAKYLSRETEYFCPSGLSDDDEKKLKQLALKAFKALGCSGWGRVDFIRQGESGQFNILEVNTVPGMTTSSLVPKAASVMGINFEQLVLSILDSSFGERK